MDKIEKLLKKIGQKDRQKLLELLESLIFGDAKIYKISKIKNSDFYRLRSGRYRIIFHKENNNHIIIDSIKLKNKDTYKRL